MTNLLSISQIAISWLVAVLAIVIALQLGAIVVLAVRRRKGVSARQQTAGAKAVTFKSVTYLTKVALLSAMAVVLLYVEFPLLPATPWLKLNVSDVPCLLATFMFGPITGTVVNGVKVGVCLLLRGTSTGFVGDLSNLISGTVYAVVAGLIYMIWRNKKGAVVALTVSSALFCGVMWLCNQYMLLPFFGMDGDPAEMTVLLWWTLLFNVIKTLLTALLTFVIYKPLSRALHWEFGTGKPSKQTPVQAAAGADSSQTSELPQEK